MFTFIEQGNARSEFLNFWFDYEADSLDILEFNTEVEHMEWLRVYIFPI